MILIDKMVIGGPDGPSFMKRIKDKIKSMQSKNRTWFTPNSDYVDLLSDNLLGNHDSYDYFGNDIERMYAEAMDEISKRTKSGKNFIWSSGIDWEDGFDSSFTDTYTSYTYKTVPNNPPRKTTNEEIIEKIKTFSHKDWRYALLDMLFVNELCTIFNDPDIVIDEVDAEILIKACVLTGLPACEFPLEEIEVGDAVHLRTVTMKDNPSKKLLSENDWEEVKSYDEKLSKCSQGVDDLCRIWAYASRRFCGAEHLVPVNNLSSLLESKNEITFGKVEELAQATGADVMLDAYFSGAPADDIIA